MNENIKSFIAPEEILQSNRLRQFYLLQRRFCEVVCCIILMFILLPIYLIICISILLIDGGPVLFKQKRVGKDGKAFTIWKFRTMESGSQQTTYEQNEWTYGVPDSFVFKSSLQHGVTKTGYFLRKSSLDEIPQLINVLFGEMSFIGPRPEVPEIANRYNPHQRLRLNLRPGITGLAQINGRSNMNHGQKIHYDLYYIKHAGFLLDIKILLLTIVKVFKTDGAY